MIFPHCFPQSLGLFWPALPLTPCRPHPDTHFALRDNFGLMSATGGVVKGPFWHADLGFKQTCKQKQTHTGNISQGLGGAPEFRGLHHHHRVNSD